MNTKSLNQCYCIILEGTSINVAWIWIGHPMIFNSIHNANSVFWPPLNALYLVHTAPCIYFAYKCLCFVRDRRRDQMYNQMGFKLETKLTSS